MEKQTIYGYARTSTEHQSLESQKHALKEYGCDEIITEQKSGKNAEDRKAFLDLIQRMETSSILVVTKLDRFARSTKDALTIIEELRERGIALVVLNMSGMQLDTTTPMGKLLVTMLSGIAEFELGLMKERQREGIEACKRRNGYKGRPVKYGEKNPKLLHALELMKNRDKNGLTVKEISHITGIGKSTLYEKIQAP